MSAERDQTVDDSQGAGNKIIVVGCDQKGEDGEGRDAAYLRQYLSENPRRRDHDDKMMMPEAPFEKMHAAFGCDHPLEGRTFLEPSICSMSLEA